MKKVQKFLFNKSALPHFGRLVACSTVYSALYLYAQLLFPKTSLILIGLSMVWILAVYFVVWLKWPPNMKAVVRLLAWQVVWLALFYMIATPLYGLSHIACQLVSGLLIILWGPCLLVWLRLVKEQIPSKDLFEQFFRRLKSGPLFNACCAVLLVLILLDTLTGGMFSVMNEVPAYRLLSVLLFQGDPMCVPMTWAVLGMYGPALASVVMACIQGWLESCLVVYGTERS